MTGPDYYRAAQIALAKAASHALITSKDPQVLFDQQMRLAEANATMARLALDAARAANLGEISNAMEVHSKATQARVDVLHATQIAWVAAVTEGGA